MSTLPSGWRLIKTEQPPQRRSGLASSSSNSLHIPYLVDALLAEVAAWKEENQTTKEHRWLHFFPRIQRMKERLLAAGVAPEAFGKWDELFSDQVQNWHECEMETKRYLLVSLLETIATTACESPQHNEDP